MSSNTHLETQKLQIEMVPQPLWGMNIRQVVTAAQWNKIRKKVMDEQNNRCSICGRKNGEVATGYDGISYKTKLVCHEDWEYEDWGWEYEDQQWMFYPEHVQRLRGFMIICTMCSYCIHFGNTQSLAARGHIRLESVKAHYMTINQCSETGFARDLQQATCLWEKRNRVDWIQEVDYSLFVWVFGEDAKESPEEVQRREAWQELRRLLREQGIKEVACRIGVPPDSIARIVGSTRQPDATNVERLIYALSTPDADIWRERLIRDEQPSSGTTRIWSMQARGPGTGTE